MLVETDSWPTECLVETASYPGDGAGATAGYVGTAADYDDRVAVGYDTVQTAPHFGWPAPRLGTN